MGKNIRRGKTGSVRCASCGQLTRRDRSVHLFRDGIKAYYCPDCAKKVHGSRLYKGLPKFVHRRTGPKVKRKFTIFSTEETADESAAPETAEIVVEEQTTGPAEEVVSDETAPEKPGEKENESEEQTSEE